MTDDIILEASHVSMIYGHNKARAAQLMEAGGEKTSVFQETGATVALWDVNFKVRRGEIFVIIGLSGSGKSTIVRCFNQLLKPTGGYAAYEGQHIDAMSKQELLEFRRSKISMVFQNFGLFTHRTVLENVVYGLEVRGVPRQERRDKAVEVIKLVGLEGWEDRPITSLSGGMKQRVGIARALANDPEVLLMDEPFSALDPLVRQDMQFELLQIQRKLGKTILFITHDINEAFKLGDTVAIMRDGKIVQIDTPAGMSMAPADDYVRAFIESADKANVLSVSSIMATPTCIVREGDDPAIAVREMGREHLSTAYAVDHDMRLLGVVPVDAALQCWREKRPLAEAIQRECVTTSPDVSVRDIMPIAAETRYPIAVVGDDGVLLGIVSRASVLSTMI
ncbi:MAG: betaine/proline/choline family ABC transporter ATP-binding protein [Oscillospiraceae bacterium]|jgi:glycine betaine/proline transport system ATP-binding protein|nr:betaine/proline/choline family ABC transporter ATP-binding protein [Oscillospiraceae bacterium]